MNDNLTANLDGVSMAEIGREFGLHKERIRQIEAIALDGLRDRIRWVTELKETVLANAAFLGVDPSLAIGAMREAIAEVMGKNAVPYVLALGSLEMPDELPCNELDTIAEADTCGGPQPGEIVNGYEIVKLFPSPSVKGRRAIVKCVTCASVVNRQLWNTMKTKDRCPTCVKTGRVEGRTACR